MGNIGGFFNNPSKATKAFFNNPVKIIDNDINKFLNHPKNPTIEQRQHMDKCFDLYLDQNINHADKNRSAKEMLGILNYRRCNNNI